MSIPKLVYYLIFLLTINSFGQNPSYFVIGESEFKNADIYSVLYTTNQKLYISTNKGLYEYRHSKFHIIPTDNNKKGTSVFNLIENRQNEVFCVNLNGQIFKIVNNKLELYFQIPEKYSKEIIEIVFDDLDRLIISSKGCIVVTENGYEELYFSNTHDALKLNKLLDNRVIVTFSKLDSLLSISNGASEMLKTKFNSNQPTLPYTMLEKNNELIPFSQISHNKIWIKSKNSGIEVYKFDDNNVRFETKYFYNTFISYISKSNCGTLFLGTFGQGLFIIPSLETKNYNNYIKGNNLQHIVADNNNNLFITDKIDGVFHFNKRVEKIRHNNFYNSNKLFLLSQRKANINSKYQNLFFGTKYGDLKNITELDSTTTLFATSLGIIKSGPSIVISENIWEEPKFLLKGDFISKIFNKRCTDVEYDKVNNQLYVSTISSLNVLNFLGELSELKFNEQSIYVNNLIFDSNQLICATQNQGILFYKNNRLQKQINTKTGLGSNYVSKIEKIDNRLYIAHRNGFQVYDLETEDWFTIGAAEGVENGSIKDFSVTENVIWFISNNQILSYPINELKRKLPQISVEIDSLLINDKKKSINTKGNFKYSESKIQFHISYKGVIYESEAYLDYKLQGTVEKEQEISVNNSTIDFTYLPPGDYKFSLVANYRDYKSESVTYNFTIEKAYWQTWWFYTLCALIIIAIVSIVLQFRNKRIQRKNIERLEKKTLETEVIASQLKALRSQMNPHFIFNSLNSIQDLVLQKNTEASYDYIVLFSELVRNALTYSNQDFISIKQEISFLDTYLKLEKLRFGVDFNYNIVNDVPYSVSVPALIVQPFVENAIVHGLFHRKGKKDLQIEFYATDDTVVCTISDNGIGRKKAVKIQERQAEGHNSYALNSITKRLEILRNKHGESVGFEILDLEDNDIAIGTKVIIHLPYLKL